MLTTGRIYGSHTPFAQLQYLFEVPRALKDLGWMSPAVGLQFFGDAWSEGRLIELAFAYEQTTGHRRAPESTPALP